MARTGGRQRSGPQRSKDVLRELQQIVSERMALDRRESELVRRARNEGLVWEQIAAALGVTKQAVHKKHAEDVARRNVFPRR